MAPKYNLHHVTKDYPFMTCLVKVNTRSNWQKTVTKVLNKCHGIHSFRMDNNGVVEISGMVDPALLLKMLGKSGGKAEMQWLQFGECSSNLFMPININMYGGIRYPHNGRYLHSGNLSRPNLPSSHDYHQTTYDHKSDYDQYHNHHYQYAHDYDKYNYGYTNDSGDIECCTVM